MFLLLVRMQKFQGPIHIVIGSESSRERKFYVTFAPGSESSRVRKFHGAKVPGSESTWERKFHNSLNSTLCAKVHRMTFDLYNYQTPRRPDCRTSKKCSGDIRLSENNSAENSPWGGGGGEEYIYIRGRGAIASSKSSDRAGPVFRLEHNKDGDHFRKVVKFYCCVCFIFSMGLRISSTEGVKRHSVIEIKQICWSYLNVFILVSNLPNA